VRANGVASASLTRDANNLELALANRSKNLQYARHEWTQIPHAVTNARDQDNRDSNRRQILLRPKCFVSRDQDFEARVHSRAKQNAVAQPEPTLCANGADVVIDKFESQRDRQ
jgi:hypothetical protein